MNFVASNHNDYKKKHSAIIAMLKTCFAHDLLCQGYGLCCAHVETLGFFTSNSRMRTPFFILEIDSSFLKIKKMCLLTVLCARDLTI